MISNRNRTTARTSVVLTKRAVPPCGRSKRRRLDRGQPVLPRAGELELARTLANEAEVALRGRQVDRRAQQAGRERVRLHRPPAVQLDGDLTHAVRSGHAL